jgi:hypothetical protein
MVVPARYPGRAGTTIEYKRPPSGRPPQAGTGKGKQYVQCTLGIHHPNVSASSDIEQRKLSCLVREKKTNIISEIDVMKSILILYIRHITSLTTSSISCL